MYKKLIFNIVFINFENKKNLDELTSSGL